MPTLENSTPPALLRCSAPVLPTSKTQRVKHKRPRRVSVGRRDSIEMQVHKVFLGPLLFSKHAVGRFFGFVFVAPLTNITALDLYYQYYLNAIFHTKPGSRYAHRNCIPIITMMIMAFLAQFDVPYFYNGAFLFAFISSCWYPVLGLYLRIPLFGFLVPMVMFALSIIAQQYYQFFRWTDDDLHSIFLPTSVFMANPLIWMFVMGCIQSVSHLAEPTMPPRMNGTDRWMSFDEYLARLRKQGLLRTCTKLVLCGFCGMIDEIWASPRLLPVLLLQLAHWCGWYPRQAKYLARLIKWCTKHNNPALDYIGRGGAADPLAEVEDELFQTYLQLKLSLSRESRREAFKLQTIDRDRLEKDEVYRCMVEFKRMHEIHVKAKLCAIVGDTTVASSQGPVNLRNRVRSGLVEIHSYPPHGVAESAMNG